MTKTGETLHPAALMYAQEHRSGRHCHVWTAPFMQGLI